MLNHWATVFEHKKRFLDDKRSRDSKWVQKFCFSLVKRGGGKGNQCDQSWHRRYRLWFEKFEKFLTLAKNIEIFPISGFDQRYFINCWWKDLLSLQKLFLCRKLWLEFLIDNKGYDFFKTLILNQICFKDLVAQWLSFWLSLWSFLTHPSGCERKTTQFCSVGLWNTF